MVRDLASLRTALGELPDLVPSRPLQLLPPVAEPKAAARGGWLRRLAGPAMAAGLVLVVVGAIGTSGFNPLGMASSAGQIFQNVGENLETGDGGEGAAEASGGDTEGPTVVSPGEQDGFSANSRSAAPSGNSVRGPVASSGSDEESQPEVAPPAPQDDGTTGLFQPADPRLPWLVVLALGVGLLFAGIFLRFSRQPRPG